MVEWGPSGLLYTVCVAHPGHVQSVPGTRPRARGDFINRTCQVYPWSWIPGGHTIGPQVVQLDLASSRKDKTFVAFSCHLLPLWHFINLPFVNICSASLAIIGISSVFCLPSLAFYQWSIWKFTWPFPCGAVPFKGARNTLVYTLNNLFFITCYRC